jgi:hypothetical protein
VLDVQLVEGGIEDTAVARKRDLEGFLARSARPRKAVSEQILPPAALDLQPLPKLIACAGVLAAAAEEVDQQAERVDAAAANEEKGTAHRADPAPGAAWALEYKAQDSEPLKARAAAVEQTAAPWSTRAADRPACEAAAASAKRPIIDRLSLAAVQQSMLELLARPNPLADSVEAAQLERDA